MTHSEFLQLCSIGVFSMSLTLSIWVYAQNQRASRTLQTARLHESWWSLDMMETRNKVYAICRDHANQGPITRELVSYYQSPLTVTAPESYPAFARLLGFFCNLEACLCSGILDNKLVYRLFCESHYLDYQPLIASIREAIAEVKGKDPLPLWLQQTIELERRFIRQGAVFKK